MDLKKKSQPKKLTAILFLVFLLTVSAGTFLNAVVSDVSSTEKKWIGKLMFRENFIDVNGGWNRLMGQKIVLDADKTRAVYRMDNEQLTFYYNEADQRRNIQSTVKLNAFLDSRQIDLLYVQAPFKVDRFNNQLPYGMTDTTNRNADTFLSGLAQAGVPYLDLRVCFHAQGVEYEELFFRTDHHWTPKAAFDAHAEVLREMSRLYGYEIDEEKIDSASWKMKNSEAPWVGSQGQRTGVPYGGSEPFEYLSPLFETGLHVDFCDRQGSLIREAAGSFEEAILRRDIIENRTMKQNKYLSYFGDDYHLVKIRNSRSRNIKKLLIIQDSFGRPFSAYMSLHFGAVDILDLRDFSASLLTEYITANNFDSVIVLYNPGSLRAGESEELFRFE